jgi:hypothetical protein
MGTTFLPILLQKYLSNPATKSQDMNSFQIKNLADGTLGTDAVNLNQVLAILPSGSAGNLPFSLDRVTPFASLGLFSNPSGDDIQFTAPSTTGKLIFTDVHGIDFVNSPSTFTYNTTGSTIKTTNSSNGIAIEADNTGSGIGARITGNTTQSAVSVVSSSNTVGTAGILVAHSGTASGVRINNTSTGDGLYVNQTGTSTYALRVDDNSTTVQSVGITKSNNGTALDINKTTGNLNALNISNGGSGYAIQTGGTKGDVLIAGTLEQNGRIIQSTGGNQPTTTISHTSGDGDAVNITKSGVNGNALDITFNATGPDEAVLLSKSSGAGDCIRVSQSGTSGGKMLSLVNTNASNGNQGLYIQSSGTGNKLEIDDSGTGSGMRISKSTNGDAIFINKTGGTAGALAIVKDGAGTDSAFYLENRSPGDCIRVLDSTSPDTTTFRVDADGRVGIGVGTGTLTDRFRSEGASGTASSLISQGTGTVELSATDTTGTSKININQANTRINGRSSIILEPQISTNADDSTPRLRLTTSGAGATEDIIYQLAQVSGQGRHAFGVSGSTNTTMNIYSNEGARRVRMGFITATLGIGNGVCNIRYDPTIHTGNPHIFLESTGATPSIAINVNGNGRIANVGAPTNANDVITASFTSYTSTGGGTKTGLTNYTKPSLDTRPVSSFVNSATFTYASGGANPLGGYYYLVTGAADPIGTTTLENAPVTYAWTTSSGNQYGVWRLRRAGHYLIQFNLRIGTSGSIPAAGDIARIRILQDNNTLPSNTGPHASDNWVWNADTNAGGRQKVLNYTETVNFADGEYITFGNNGGAPSATQTIAIENFQVIFTYLGNLYS